MKMSKRGKPWTVRYITKTPRGPRVVTIQDGRVFLAYLPASLWNAGMAAR